MVDLITSSWNIAPTGNTFPKSLKNISNKKFRKNQRLVRKYGLWNDSDRDGVINRFDCFPFNRKKQDITTPQEADMYMQNLRRKQQQLQPIAQQRVGWSSLGRQRSPYQYRNRYVKQQSITQSKQQIQELKSEENRVFAYKQQRLAEEKEVAEWKFLADWIKKGKSSNALQGSPSIYAKARQIGYVKRREIEETQPYQTKTSNIIPIAQQQVQQRIDTGALFGSSLLNQSLNRVNTTSNQTAIATSKTKNLLFGWLFDK